MTPSRFIAKTDAIDCFTSRSLSNVPAAWVADVLQSRGMPNAMPMWNMLFLVDDPCVAEKVRKHFAEYDFGEDMDRQRLLDCGWRVIPPTGLFARQIDGLVLIGVDGAGYDFFEAHWEPLYDLLGYRWHLDD